VEEELISASKSPNGVASADDVNMVIGRLREAKRPVLLVGGGVSRNAATELQSRMNFTRIPVMTTWNGTDRVDSASDVYLGRPNTWGQRGANLLVAQSDLLIAVGTRLGMQQTGFNWQSYGLNACVVHVDIDQAELDKGHPRTDIRLRADADDFLRRLVEVDYPGWEEWLTYAREVLSLLPLDDPENETGSGFVSPYSFYSELSTLATSKDMIIPCSSGGANSVSMQVIAQKKGQVIITDKGLASMGYGLAGAIGAAMAHPGRRTFLVEGDGGFAQNLQELATVAVNNLPIKIFIFANNGYGSIRMTQKNYFGGAYLGCDTETGLGFPEWKTLFGSFGVKCMDIGEGWASDPEVLAALESDEPWGFIVPIDPLQTYWPKITSRITESGSMESNPLHMMSPDLAPELRAKVTRFL
jgi:acetolactate synthase-1/2/3 large subunit